MFNEYRKKPVVINAVKVTNDNVANIVSIITNNGGSCRQKRNSADFSPHSIVISTIEGDMEATVGNWIIRGVAGEFYPCKDSIFRETYEKVE